jgi:hypothetical protein
MRRLGLLSLLLLLAGCRGTQSFTQQDLSDVKQAWNALNPTMQAFRQGYKTGNASTIQGAFRQNEIYCKIVDGVDKRDTIDPNVNLFQASIALDDICNNIESVYVEWEKAHGLPYDTTIVPSRPGDEFLGLDKEMKKVPNYLRNPGSLS